MNAETPGRANRGGGPKVHYLPGLPAEGKRLLGRGDGLPFACGQLFKVG